MQHIKEKYNTKYNTKNGNKKAPVVTPELSLCSIQLSAITLSTAGAFFWIFTSASSLLVRYSVMSP